MQYSSPQATSTRGKFSNNVWYCDCQPPVPAARFQVKKDGINHGKWFYTCEKLPPTKCEFFLFEDEAEKRKQENQAVLADMRSEPKTPERQGPNQCFGLSTPVTGRAHARPSAREFVERTVSLLRRTHGLSSKKDSYSGDEILDKEAVDLLSSNPSGLSQPVFIPSTPDQTPTKNTSANKRKFDDFTNQLPPPSSQSNITTYSPKRVALSTRRDYSNLSQLSSSVLEILDRHNVDVPAVREEITAFLEKEHLKAKGVLRSREMSWTALKKKDEEIMSLKEQIRKLERE